MLAQARATQRQEVERLEQELVRANSTRLQEVQDTVDDNLEHTATTLAHQDRVLNWAFRKLDSEGKQLKALNISKVASEKKADVLEKELSAEQQQEASSEKALLVAKQEIAAEQAQDETDRAVAEGR